MAKKTKRRTRKRRLVQGRDWHAWAWEYTGGDWRGSRLMRWASVEKPNIKLLTGPGQWVRVRFVKVRQQEAT